MRTCGPRTGKKETRSEPAEFGTTESEAPAKWAHTRVNRGWGSFLSGQFIMVVVFLIVVLCFWPKKTEIPSECVCVCVCVRV